MRLLSLVPLLPALLVPGVQLGQPAARLVPGLLPALLVPGVQLGQPAARQVPGLRLGQLLTMCDAETPATASRAKSVHGGPSKAAASLVIAQGPGWLVVNKPAGTAVHDGPLSVLALLKGAGLGGECAPVHRLDIQTSGVMLLAKTPDAVPPLQRALASQTTLKTYRAILRGRIKVPTGQWKRKLSTKSEGRRNPQVRDVANDGIDFSNSTIAVALQ